MIRTKRIFTIGIGAFVLLLGLGTTVYYKFSKRAVPQHEKLLSELPAVVEGWVVKDMPIASSVEMQKAVSELLNYDEAIFREYSKNGKTLTVYAAYWRPYRFHPRLISVHTPDICWVGNGWTMKSTNSNYGVSLSEGRAWHAQERVFEVGGSQMNVIYWHILDGRLSGYAEGSNSIQTSFLKELLNDLKHGAGEQFFIRISSPQPWASWVDDPLYRQILDTFAPVLKATEGAGAP
jgi:hypothetical protein